ncbi:hypothetical protein ACQCVP_17870 [Rossellomorea vietnamensis]|uniref:hypothetical protein n=1 Tax=Rossellomorea vietnamensis TaxID=218284 RepID=UPI003CF7834F
MWDFHFSIIGFVTGFLAWAAIGFLAYRINRKQDVKPGLWKMALVIIAGLFSFSINWPMFGTVIRLSILPLGVWILYAVLKSKDGRWETYRRFAWLGFWANFIFLISAFISMPIHDAFYPEEKPSTYISNVRNASLIPIHPSAGDRSLNKKVMTSQLDNFETDRIMSQEWYQETYMNPDMNKKNERFPYLLIGVKPKWGSGIKSIIYIENDGKGMLISAAGKQSYFRAGTSIFKEGKQSE